LSVLKKNLNELSILKQANIINRKIEDFLKNCKKKFNIFFFDPPFIDESFVQGLILIKKNKNFLVNNLIIIHRERKNNENLEKYIRIITTKNYGRSKIIFGLFN